MLSKATIYILYLTKIKYRVSQTIRQVLFIIYSLCFLRATVINSHIKQANQAQKVYFVETVFFYERKIQFGSGVIGSNVLG